GSLSGRDPDAEALGDGRARRRRHRGHARRPGDRDPVSDAAGSTRVAVLDACALVPIRLATTLLWLAEAGSCELLWSDRILDEVQRNLPKLGISQEKAVHRVRTMRGAFGEAALVDDFDHLITDMTCDPKDRHVLAAAVRGKADTLVTFNLKDFPSDSTSGW